MNLKEAQNKLSSDISQLYETYQLISKSKQHFNDLDVALLQQQLLYVYHSLLKVQGQLAQLPENTDEITPALAAQVIKQHVVEEVTPLDIAIAEVETAQITPEEVLAPLTEAVVELETEPETIASVEEHTEPEIKTPEVEIVEVEETPKPNTLVFDFNANTEPTLDDLEKLMEEKEKAEEQVPQVQATLPLETPKVEAKPAVEPAPELSLLDKLSASMRTPDVYEKIAREQQQSLKQAINLNKKIAFVNNLFNENTVEYAKAIEKLNASTTVHEALRYFNELKHQYSWSNENALVKELEGLIEKRFA
ncbi:MAG: hypothetical protein ACK44D_00450 [Bacteroidia bacterium]